MYKYEWDCHIKEMRFETQVDNYTKSLCVKNCFIDWIHYFKKTAITKD